MMNIEEYISSGVLESYVLGLLPETEAWDVEWNAQQYPEIRSEISKIEKALENYSAENGIQPPPDIEELVQSKITETPQLRYEVERQASDDSSTKEPRSRLFILLSILGLIAFATLSFLLWQSSQEKDKIAQEYKTLTESCTEENNKQNEIISILRNPTNKIIAMQGTDKAPDAVATIYWNDIDKVAFLDAVNLPSPPQGKQYQLWAIVGDNPVDMGVFDLPDSTNLIKKEFIQNPAAFAITLEDEGGKPNPTLEEMVVIGNFG